ncbi:MAG: bifunctional methylenetetrahydrofolate dehydrogenase/methenyltetrahydrofolate cyclohydrolase FolD [Candidatus Binatia bacterium]
MGQIIDGTAAARAVRAAVQREVEGFQRECGRAPGLATVLVGDNAASATYVRSKHKACADVGIASYAHDLPVHTTQEELLHLVHALNRQPHISGILVQLPLPAHLHTDAIIDAIDPDKDVDGLHPLNQARLFAGREGLRPCTPLGIMHLIEHTGVEIKGARAVVTGRSILVGKPVAFMLLERHATLTICHSRTRDLAEEVGRADILVAAVGHAEMIRGEWVRPGSVVIDVGINRLPDKRLVGDVEFAAARERAGFITPVPGGVGPMTVAMLMRNTLTAARRRLQSSR